MKARERVYEQTKLRFGLDIEIMYVNYQKALLVNNDNSESPHDNSR